MFREKENLHSQLETVKEEKAKLAKVVERALQIPSQTPPFSLLQENKELVKENAQLSGHRNLQQRIQYHAKLKLDYHKLIEACYESTKHITALKMVYLSCMHGSFVLVGCKQNIILGFIYG